MSSQLSIHTDHIDIDYQIHIIYIDYQVQITYIPRKFRMVENKNL
jgi:hypothetical protein